MYFTTKDEYAALLQQLDISNPLDSLPFWDFSFTPTQEENDSGPSIEAIPQFETKGRKQARTRAADPLIHNWDGWMSSILAEIGDKEYGENGDYQEETENMLEYVPTIGMNDRVDLLGLRNLTDNLINLSSKRSKRRIELFSEHEMSSYKFILDFARMEEGIFKRCGIYFQKTREEIWRDIANHFSCDDKEQLLSSAEEVAERHGYEIPDDVAGHPRHKPTESPRKETKYQEMIKALINKGEAVKASEVLEGLRRDSGLDINYMDIATVASEVYEEDISLGDGSHLHPHFSENITVLFRDMEEFDAQRNVKQYDGHSALEIWRAERGIIEHNGTLYRKYGDGWIDGNNLYAHPKQLDLIYQTYRETGHLPKSPAEKS